MMGWKSIVLSKRSNFTNLQFRQLFLNKNCIGVPCWNNTSNLTLYRHASHEFPTKVPLFKQMSQLNYAIFAGCIPLWGKGESKRLICILHLDFVTPKTLWINLERTLTTYNRCHMRQKLILTFEPNISIFPVLYQISLIRRLSWTQIKPVKHDWKLLKVFLCLPLTVGSLV